MRVPRTYYGACPPSPRILRRSSQPDTAERADMPDDLDARLQLTPTQQALYDALLEKHGALAELYRAAIAVLNDAVMLDRFALAAHDLRELLEKLLGEEVDLGAGLNAKIGVLEPLWKQAAEQEQASGNGHWTGQVTDSLRAFLVAAQAFFTERTGIAATRNQVLVRYLHSLDPAQVKLPKELQQRTHNSSLPDRRRTLRSRTMCSLAFERYGRRGCEPPENRSIRVVLKQSYCPSGGGSPVSGFLKHGVLLRCEPCWKGLTRYIPCSRSPRP